MPIVVRVSEDETFVSFGGDEEVPDGEGLGGWVVSDKFPVTRETLGEVESLGADIALDVGLRFVVTVGIFDEVEYEEFTGAVFFFGPLGAEHEFADVGTGWKNGWKFFCAFVLAVARVVASGVVIGYVTATPDAIEF